MRYTRDELERLRDSPLVVRPANLPPAEEYMGASQEADRKTNNRERRESAGLLDQTNRRSGLDKFSRNGANPVEIILGPPKTSFASATSARNAKPSDLPERPPYKEQDSRDRHPFRKSDGENDRTRDNQRFNLRSRRLDADQDSEGWSTVKPRKSFGAEGSERFNGRMGGDRHRDEQTPMPRRGSRDARDNDARDRPARGFEAFSRDREAIKESAEESDGVARRNGLGRGRNESWFKDKDDSAPPVENRKSNGDRFGDRNRGWREKDHEKANERNTDRNTDRDRGGDRDERTTGRWDRDNRRHEREPEWMDEPSSDKKRAHTQEDFQKWKESMNAGIMKTPATEEPPNKAAADVAGQSSFFGFEKAKVETPLVMDPGPDKFLSIWSNPKADGVETQLASKKEGPSKSNTTGKASRFTSFFAAPLDDTQRRQTEPVPAVPSVALKEANPQSDKEKEDFQRLLQKLQSQSIMGMKTPTPPANQASQPKPPPQKQMNAQPPALEPFQQYRPGFQEPPRSGSRESQSQQAALQDLLGNRSTAVSQPSSRPDTMVHELVNQRQNTLSQGSSRPDQDINRNAAFLMGLMQNARPAPEPLRAEQLMMRPPPSQPSRQQQQQMNEREQELLIREQRERAAQRQRQEPPLGFFDDAFLGRGPQQESRSQAQQQPTQILQRPPPGLEQLPPGWAQQQREQQLPQSMSQQRHPLQPPPGLASGPNRGMPMPPMFPPGFSMPGYGPPPENMMNAPRNMPPPPPPGFMVPPPGFMAPPPMSGFPGPEGLGYAPFDGRGGPPPPQGNFRR